MPGVMKRTKENPSGRKGASGEGPARFWVRGRALRACRLRSSAPPNRGSLPEGGGLQGKGSPGLLVKGSLLSFLTQEALGFSSFALSFPEFRHYSYCPLSFT